MTILHSLEMRSRFAPDGTLTLYLEETEVPKPGPGEVIIKIDAAPINPSDIIMMLGPVDPKTVTAGGTVRRPTASAKTTTSHALGLKSRWNVAWPVGSEGAGVVIEAGPGLNAWEGRAVALRSPLGMFSQYRVAKTEDCLVLPEAVMPRDAASAFINPLTALGMLETMRRDGHKALVHTAAASNLGQMLNRLCIADAVPLVNIVRNSVQAELLLRQGAKYVLDSRAESFNSELVKALVETEATLAFDAIGGGTMAATIVRAMEEALRIRGELVSRYGSSVRKQIYIYGILDTGPKILEGDLGMSWSVGGWLMTWFYQQLDTNTVQRLKARVANELTTTFVSRYTSDLSLSQALLPENIMAYARRATGEKFVIRPNAEL